MFSQTNNTHFAQPAGFSFEATTGTSMFGQPQQPVQQITSFGQTMTTQSSFSGYDAALASNNLIGTQQNVNTSMFGTAGSTSAFRQAAQPAGFGFEVLTESSIFGQPQQHVQQTTPFGQITTPTNTATDMTGTGMVKFNPAFGTDIMVKRGKKTSISTRYICIMCMKKYKNKTLEELRLEDYTAGLKGPAQLGQSGDRFVTSTQALPFPNTGAITSTCNTGFGTTNQSTASGDFFEKPISAFGASTTTTSAFVSNPTTSSNPFGANTQTKSFVATGLGTIANAQNDCVGSFGAPQQNRNIELFNQNKPAFSLTPAKFNPGFETTSSGFGTTNQSTASGDFFGKPISAFGASTTTTSAFAFNPTTSSNPFGANTQTKSFVATGLGTIANTQNDCFGSFGAPQQNRNIELFNQNKPAFSLTPAKFNPVFETTSSGFGTTNQSTASGDFFGKPISAFGASTTTTSAFAINPTTSSNPFGANTQTKSFVATGLGTIANAQNDCVGSFGAPQQNRNIELFNQNKPAFSLTPAKFNPGFETTSSGFGTTNQSTASGDFFGKPISAFGASTTTTSAFAFNPTTSSNPFGANTQTISFVATGLGTIANTQNDCFGSFGAPQQNRNIELFNQNKPAFSLTPAKFNPVFETTSSGFGTTNQSTASGDFFGKPISAFGASTTTTSAFAINPTTSSNPFGANTQTKSFVATGLGTIANTQNDCFGSFGAPQQNRNIELFNQNKPAFSLTPAKFNPVFETTSSGFGTTNQSTASGDFFGKPISAFGASTITTSAFASNNSIGTQPDANTSWFDTAGNTSAIGQAAKPANFGFEATPRSSIFGQPEQPVQQTTPFGQTTTPTNTATGMTGTGMVKFNPVTGTYTKVKGGKTTTILTRYHSIMCMKEYEKKSLEELRLEDYTAGLKGPAQLGQSGGLYRTLTQALPFPNTGAITCTGNTSFEPMSSGFGTTNQSTASGEFFEKPVTAFGATAPSTVFPSANSKQSTYTNFGLIACTQNTSFDSFDTSLQYQNIELFDQNKPAFNHTPATSNTGFGFAQNTLASTSNSLFGAKPTTGFATTSTFESTPVQGFGVSTGFDATQNTNTSFLDNFFKPAAQTFHFRSLHIDTKILKYRYLNKCRFKYRRMKHIR